MRKSMSRTAAEATLALGLTLSAVGAQQTPFGINGPLKVCGTQLCNQYGHPIQLRGISTHGLQWYPWGDCLKEESMQSLATDWGADVVRVAMYMQEDGWTTDKPKYTAMVDQVIESATAKGMYVIIDFHQLSPGDPNGNYDNAVEYFNIMAAKHGSKGNILYEICNEPNGVNWSSIKQYADKIIPVIRKLDAKSPIIVGTMGWSSLGISGQGPWTDIVANPVSDPNAMYTFHFYAKSHGDNYRNTVRAASEKLPIFVTEFGTQEYTGDGPNDFGSSQAWLDLLAEKKISWVVWNFSDDFRSSGLLNENVCPNGPWTGGALKESGSWIQARMKTPDNFPASLKRGQFRQGSAPPFAMANSLNVTMLPGAIQIDVNLSGAYSVEIRALSGRRVAHTKGKGPRSFTLEQGGIVPGTHVVEVRQGKKEPPLAMVF